MFLSLLEGSFSSDISIKKGYTYFALGNPYIMNLVHQAAKPSVAILKHGNNKGILMIYKIAVRDAVILVKTALTKEFVTGKVYED